MGSQPKTKLGNHRITRVVNNARSRRMAPPLPGEKAGGRAVVARMVSSLLAWFSTHARDLPWRRAQDPYAIWVSEIMLQQTQVKTVIPYWERWMRELPTIKAAANASPARLHKLWEGLGYYTRVRNLQKAAQQIITQHNGHFPETFDNILSLPGVGRYTAGAICSISFNQPTPILDGNVIRVLARIHGITSSPRDKKTNAKLWQLAQELVAHASRFDSFRGSRREGAHSEIKSSQGLLPSAATIAGACSALNQSLMELGALICSPRSPNCTACPVQKLCVAFRESRQEQLPKLGRRTAATARRFIAFVVARDGKFLVRQRPAGVVNGHLWEFPNVEMMVAKGRARHSVYAAGRTLVNGAQRSDAPCQASDFNIPSAKPLRVVKHSITRYRITLEAYRADLASPPTKAQGNWLRPEQLHQLAFTSAHKKILNHIVAPIPDSARRKQ